VKNALEAPAVSDILRRGAAAATITAMEPPIEHRDVTTIMRLIGDIQLDVTRIRELLEDEDGEEEELPEDDS
jgi:phage host-nuclease inhibitor protein Gam